MPEDKKITISPRQKFLSLSLLLLLLTGGSFCSGGQKRKETKPQPMGHNLEFLLESEVQPEAEKELPQKLAGYDRDKDFWNAVASTFHRGKISTLNLNRPEGAGSGRLYLARLERPERIYFATRRGIRANRLRFIKPVESGRLGLPDKEVLSWGLVWRRNNRVFPVSFRYSDGREYRLIRFTRLGEGMYLEAARRGGTYRLFRLDHSPRLVVR